MKRIILLAYSFFLLLSTSTFATESYTQILGDLEVDTIFFFDGSVSSKSELIGATGPQGLKGDTGATGATGPQGLSGTSLLNGSVDPTGSNGNDGDFYLNTSTNVLFGPKNSGIWPSGISLIGQTGPQGPKGDTGATGAVGPQGPTGATGPQGPPAPSAICTYSGKTFSTGAICRTQGTCTSGTYPPHVQCSSDGSWYSVSGACGAYPYCGA